MKLATFVRAGGAQAVGIVDTDRGQVLDLQQAAEAAGTASPAFASMLHLIEAGQQALDVARSVERQWFTRYAQPLAATRLLSPLPEPRQMRDCLVFEAHLLNAMKTWEKRTGNRQFGTSGPPGTSAIA